ncbi:hypothetical protein TNCV_4072881 [Trichonephila clavipes]|uniref:Uncharacterized protein n=1 Tax=Trichonephila clavipes TaxID=2585209 RepID=A0A8X6W802_TRICX|nr:hypothetical protein TNCV_4072881 [Trichonephila clavipes]
MISVLRCPQPFTGENFKSRSQFTDLPDFWSRCLVAYRRSLLYFAEVQSLGQKSVSAEILRAAAPRKSFRGSINRLVTSTLRIHSLAFLPHKWPILLSTRALRSHVRGNGRMGSCQNRCVPSKDRCEENASGESVHLWVSEKKRWVTSNSSRVSPTSVSPQGVRKEYEVNFETKTLLMILLTLGHQKRKDT